MGLTRSNCGSRWQLAQVLISECMHLITSHLNGFHIGAWLTSVLVLKLIVWCSALTQRGLRNPSSAEQIQRSWASKHKPHLHKTLLGVDPVRKETGRWSRCCANTFTWRTLRSVQKPFQPNDTNFVCMTARQSSSGEHSTSDAIYLNGRKESVASVPVYSVFRETCWVP